MTIWQELQGAFDRYRPERHYMRGPGPKWWERHGATKPSGGLAEPIMLRTTVESSNLLPSAKEAMEKLALAEAKKASEALRQKEMADAKKKALLDQLSMPSGISEQEAFKRAATIIERAVKNGLTEVEVFRFPNALCTDGGRAINNELEPGWENTLTGLPQEMYQFWDRHLRPLGYSIRVRVVDFSGGMPGYIGLTLKLG